MKKNHLGVIALMLLLSWSSIYGQYEWSDISVPANPGTGKTWDLVESMSDDFSYSASFNAGEYANRTNFGSNNKWYNFYHNPWDGPGRTFWDTSNVSVDGDNLVITAGYTAEETKTDKKTKGNRHGVASGCVTSNDKVTYPVYVESSVSVANISLASCFWLLSPDDTEEIDIIENYGGVKGFKNTTHISHHSFVRKPFTDYQPRDRNSWYAVDEVTNAGGWGNFCWNGGNRRYMRMGMNWIGPKHWEYYIDGELVRVMYYNAMATKKKGKWEYTYYRSTTPDKNGYIFPTDGSDDYSLVTLHTTSNNYSFSTLQEASESSKGYSVIDTGWFQGRDNNDVDGNGVTDEPLGFTKELEIIINIESQRWLLKQTPSETDLNDPSKNQMKVDWIRVYKPSASPSNVSVTGVSVNPTSLPLNIGETASITGTIEPSNATIKTIVFTSNNTAVATVDAKGVVTAISAGTASIIATTTDGNFTASTTVTVTDARVPVTGVSLDPKSLPLNIGETAYITGTIEPSNATIKTMVFASNNIGVATVDAKGVVTAISAGTASIIATTTDGNFTASTTITVGGAPDGGTINLALNKPSSQSSIYNNISVLGAKTANDGNYTTFNHTLEDKEAWWQVDLGTVSDITNIEIYNRVDCCSERLSDFHVFVSDVPFTSTNLKETQEQPGIGDYVTAGAAGNVTSLNVNRTGRYVRVQLSGTNFLHMREVVVNGTEGEEGTSPGSGPSEIITVEAERFNATGGTFNDSFAAGPGLGVKNSNSRIEYVNSGDWVEYLVDVPEPGAYEITYFISTPNNGATIDFSSKGVVSSRTDVPNTNGWENYEGLNASNVATFATAGVHLIRLSAGGKEWAWNLDKFTLNKISRTNLKISLGDISEKNELNIFPNPVRQLLHLENVEGYHTVNFYDILGTRIMTKKLTTNYIDLSTAINGIYMVEFVGNAKTEIKKIVVKH